MISVRVYKPYAEVLQWLQDNVGPMLHYKPVIFWHGQGWHLKTSYDVAPRGQIGRHFCIVEFEDEQTAAWFSLRWQ